MKSPVLLKIKINKKPLSGGQPVTKFKKIKKRELMKSLVLLKIKNRFRSKRGPEAVKPKISVIFKPMSFFWFL